MFSDGMVRHERGVTPSWELISTLQTLSGFYSFPNLRTDKKIQTTLSLSFSLSMDKAIKQRKWIV